MSNVNTMVDIIKNAMKNSQTPAERGYINGNLVVIGTDSYPYTAAVDCKVNSGDYVWCQRTKTGTAVIVGM